MQPQTDFAALEPISIGLEHERGCGIVEISPEWRQSMARPYSVDLRERVLGVHEAGEGSQRCCVRVDEQDRPDGILHHPDHRRCSAVLAH